MYWEKSKITKQNGQVVEAQAPIIISASRSTDIPAFYSDWFVQRIKEGFLQWKNPFNGTSLYVSLKRARLVVFWSKNPNPIMSHLTYIDDKIKNYYFQYTLNDYEKENLEPNVPDIQARIDTFLQLSEKIGKDRVIWRFDPLVLTEEIGVNELLRKVEKIGDQLKNHTKKFVFSFADIKIYKKVQNNLRKNSIKYFEFNEILMKEFSAGIQELNRNWQFEIGTCAEQINLEKYGIIHNKCIDDDLIIKLFPNDKILMDFLGAKMIQGDFFDSNVRIEKKYNKDKGQREYCGCIPSKDIGEYNTCPHLCEYCYANTSKVIALANWKFHKQNPYNEMIKGD